MALIRPNWRAWGGALDPPDVGAGYQLQFLPDIDGLSPMIPYERSYSIPYVHGNMLYLWSGGGTQIGTVDDFLEFWLQIPHGAVAQAHASLLSTSQFAPEASDCDVKPSGDLGSGRHEE